VVRTADEGMERSMSMQSTATQIAWGFGVTVDLTWEEAVERTKAELKREGFGVLTEIDVQRTMHEKLGVDYEPYVILGACNPQLANQALTSEREIGLLLPCNVVVRAVDGGRTSVSVMDPQAALGIAGLEAIAPVAAEARERLERVVQAIAGVGGAA
jgi:uncharacterized protein (DUF302 family)